MSSLRNRRPTRRLALPVALVAGLLAVGAAAGPAAANHDRHRRVSSCDAPVQVVVGPRHRGHRGHQACRHWQPPTWTVRSEKVCVAPARLERHWCAPVYETRYTACGSPYQVLVKPGHWQTREIPARYEVRQRRVQVAGRWVSCGDVCAHRPRRGARNGRLGFRIGDVRFRIGH